MDKIQVSILHESHTEPGGMMMFLARLTQRGHAVTNMEDLLELYVASVNGRNKRIAEVASLPHGTIKRFTPITIAIVGASRRFLAQARTHQVGMTYVSGSLQYSDYSNKAEFTVPYELLDKPEQMRQYLSTCHFSMGMYECFTKSGISNDTAGYMAPQGLRNILIMQGNHEAWTHFIRMRSCKRNTTETRIVATKIWDVLLNESADGAEMFKYAGPDCVYGMCREGKMTCGIPLGLDTPTEIIAKEWPLLTKEIQL